ncbi:MAG: NAD(P)/FAD-dependent oxidoreductase [Acidobacteria bacterium]|nr:NAD(P)/FAD-dependent oxidoreductase [Acidobacteriota bacterium]
MKAEFDAIIVGGGPAGASAAVHLAASGARVLLAERERFPRDKLCGEFISPECLTHFERLGVSEAMSRGGGARVSETVFYAPSGRGVSVPSAWFGGQGGDALGLSRAEMDARLLARAREIGATVIEKAALASLVVEGARVRGVRLHVEGGDVQEFRARVTLDATGRHRAVVRRAERDLGREENGRHERRAALVAFKAHLEGARGAEGVCEIYFYPGGYGGLSPVEKGLSNLCFITRAGDVRAAASDPERVLREVLLKNRRAAESLKDATARTRWLGVSLEGFGRHEPAPFEGLLAVGDAAAFIDPFTGSGMLMALEGGELAARALSDWLARGGRNFDEMARHYRRAYAERFGARLRLCGLLRRAALAPAALAEVSVVALNASASLRRRLARSTRGNGRR